MPEWAVWLKENLAFWIVGLYAVSESLKKLINDVDVFSKAFKKIGITTKRMRDREKEKERLNTIETAIIEIKNTSEKNVNMFLAHEKQVVDGFMGVKDEIITKLDRLDAKIDTQKTANDKTFCAMLRNDIDLALKSVRTYVDGEGNKHISLSDYENLDELFKEYIEEKHGNGAYKAIYQNEVQKYIIDR